VAASRPARFFKQTLALRTGCWEPKRAFLGSPERKMRCVPDFCPIGTAPSLHRASPQFEGREPISSVAETTEGRAAMGADMVINGDSKQAPWRNNLASEEQEQWPNTRQFCNSTLLFRGGLNSGRSRKRMLRRHGPDGSSSTTPQMSDTALTATGFPNQNARRGVWHGSTNM
jgi:hypothetical protein